MPTYWISFRIHDATLGGRTYQERLKAVYDVASAFRVPNAPMWEGTTSFIILPVSKPIMMLAQALRGAIVPTHDLVLVHSRVADVGAVIGNNPDNSLSKLMPYLKKL